MAKYSEEFKIEIVREYLDGRLGFTSLAKKHNIKSTTQIRYWVNAYKKHGVTGLMRKKTTGASYTETALQFELTNPSMITSWNKKFLEGGEEALDQLKGRPAMSDKE